ncbi:MAG: hypothetical protein MRECE_4c005 [Mycoplasmataceae bacterium CE_OT135]|nr:MAG: hypothetical protein MRECE_4c005 [Mycoplasmataceae bacterium CE_OT135]
MGEKVGFWLNVFSCSHNIILKLIFKEFRLLVIGF